MKLLVFVFLATLATGYSQPNTDVLPRGILSLQLRGLVDKLEEFLDVKLRETMATGSPSLGIPPLDPLQLDQLSLAVEEEIAQGKVDLSDILVVSLSGYKVNKVTFSIVGMKAAVDLSWPVLVANTKYSLQGKAMGIDIFGDGEIAATVTDLRIKIQAQVGIAGIIQLKTLKVDISLGKLNLLITGLFHDEELSRLVSEIVSDITPGLITDYHDQVMPKISETLKVQVNGFLKNNNITLTSLLG